MFEESSLPTYSRMPSLDSRNGVASIFENKGNAHLRRGQSGTPSRESESKPRKYLALVPLPGLHLQESRTERMERITFRLHVTGTATKAKTLCMARNVYLIPPLSEWVNCRPPSLRIWQVDKFS